MSNRELLKKQFLASANCLNGVIQKLPADASFRTYDRLTLNDKSYIVMDAPPSHENVKSFIKVLNFLDKNGFSVPKLFESDLKNGFLLLEDFGDDSFAKLLNHNKEEELEEQLYKSAIDLLVNLQKIPPIDGEFAYYSDELLLDEAKGLIEWYIPLLNGEQIPTKLIEEYEIIWRHLLQYARHIPETTVLRDYHAENLMWLADRDGYQRVGILDFQDAVIGSPVYDMVSLLEDARRDVNSDLSDKMITYYLSKRTDITRRDFLASYSILGAQRNLKIIGFIARKAVRDKNSKYFSLLPRVWGYIEKDLKHPLMLPLKAWLDKVISPQIRKPQRVHEKTNA